MRAFICCAPEDVARGDALAAALRARGVEIVGGRDALQASDRWPASVGAAIAGCSHFVLLFSARAATSHAVDLEWHVAVALGKSVIPVLLDHQPLPPTLARFGGLGWGALESPTTVAAAVVRRQPARRRPLRAALVLRELGAVRSTGALAVVEVKARLGRWLEGAGALAEARTAGISEGVAFFELGDWGFAGLAALILGAAAVVDVLLFSGDLASATLKHQRANELELESIAGIVRDEHGTPLVGVRVLAVAFAVEAISKRDGSYRLELRARRHQEVALRASCEDGACRSFEGLAVVGDQERFLTLKGK